MSQNNKRDPRFRQDTPVDPFRTYDSDFKSELMSPFEPFKASPISGAENQNRRKAMSDKEPVGVALPPHLFAPADSQSVDIRNLVNVPPATTDLLIMSFRGLPGGITRFIGYGVFFDALMFDLINMVPTVNGVRVFPLNGNPNAKFKIGLGTGADLSNTNLIACLLDLVPGDLLEWRFTNNDAVDVAAGVRMSGYYTQGISRPTGRFGG